MKKLLFFLFYTNLALPLCAQPLLSQSKHEMNARVVGFDQEHYLRVLQYNRVYKVKLFGIQMPRTSEGIDSLEQYLTQRVLGQVVAVRSTQRLSHGVLLAEIMLHGKSLNQQLLQRGICRPMASESQKD